MNVLKLRFARRRARAAGFTLVELLVVIAVIALLAALLLPALSRAKRAADSTVCKSNLRQIAIGLRLYVNDFAAYPRLAMPPRSWADDLENYVGAKWPEQNQLTNGNGLVPRNGVYACPGYNRIPGYFRPTGMLAGSYGYNDDGVSAGPNDGLSDAVCLGLGGMITVAGKLYDFRPVREASVVDPSDMIAIAEAQLQRIPIGVAQGGPLFGPLAGYTRLTDNFWFPIVAEEVTGTKSAWSDSSFFSDVPAAIERWHGRRMNLVFCDGHVENRRIREVFIRSDAARRRWNNDHQPHFEYPSP